MTLAEELSLKKILPSNGPAIQEVQKYIAKYINEFIVIKCGGSVLLEKNLFDQFIQDISIINKLGLHARAAAKIVTLTNNFNSSVTIKNGEKSADAKSIMKILMLSAPKGTLLKVKASGEDESKAIIELEKLINSKFKEE